MKIAILGKGGSGKSTVAAYLTRYFATDGYEVLAIDADHNMDLGFNLGVEPTKFLGTDPGHIKEFAGVGREASFKDALDAALAANLTFSFAPADAFTAHYAEPVGPRVWLMTAGPHTDTVRSLRACSHSLAAPLKVYLPLLALRDRQVVVIDERAGTDPVATGILSGVDLAVIVRENTPNSHRVAEQIARELELQNIPYLVVDNKEQDMKTDLAAITESILKNLT